MILVNCNRLKGELPVQEALRGDVSGVSALEEFPLSDDERTEDLYISAPLETLNLNDTLVEIEPTPNSDNETDLK